MTVITMLEYMIGTTLKKCDARRLTMLVKMEMK